MKNALITNQIVCCHQYVFKQRILPEFKYKLTMKCKANHKKATYEYPRVFTCIALR